MPGRPPRDHPTEGAGNRDWWPNQLNLRSSRRTPPMANPMGEEFDYAAAFKTLDLDAVKRDIDEVMTTSQDWWPADFGHYGPLFIRMAWHSAGTYRISDGRGGAGAGMQRFAPLNSWPDNGNLDKARRLLWPVKKKYGQQALVGRPDGPRRQLRPGVDGLQDLRLRRRSRGRLGARRGRLLGPRGHLARRRALHRRPRAREPAGAVQMGLIYVNPEGPNGNPDPLAAARDIRETFRRMAMNDEETVALIAGGHTFGKTHGAADPEQYVGPEPEGAPLERAGPRLEEHASARGKGRDAITSGLEVTWTPTPTTWDNSFFETLFGYEWELIEEPGRCEAVEAEGRRRRRHGRPTREDPSLTRPPMMLTTDLSLRIDPVYEPISRRFLEHPDEFADAFARAWFKLTHRDMGPIARYLGPLVPHGDADLAGPGARGHPRAHRRRRRRHAQGQILASGLSVSQLVSTAWASASTFRGSDKRGGANGARIRLEPQNGWEVNDPDELATVLRTLRGHPAGAFNAAQTGGKQVSLADLIVLGGCAAVEQAAKNAGHDVEVPFTPGRTDAVAGADRRRVLRRRSSRPRTGSATTSARGTGCRRSTSLLDRANLLTLSAPEMTVLVGGLRVLGANVESPTLGVFTATPESLTNDFFVNLLDLGTAWTADVRGRGDLRGSRPRDRRAQVDRQPRRPRLRLELRAACRSPRSTRATTRSEKFVRDFVAAWDKVMNLDRFDLA